MSDFKVRKLESGQARIRTVPIAVTPEGFWCCPSPAVLQKTLKNSNHHHNKHKKPTSPQPPLAPEIPPIETQIEPVAETPDPGTAHDPSPETQQRKISVGFGQPETSDLNVVLYGKEGIAVCISAHKEVLSENSSFFREKLGIDSRVTCIELSDCDDVEIYVESIGLMYCKEVKNRLVKQSVPRVLRLLKVAKSLGFKACIISCLDYLEAVPWVGEEEEESVLSSIKALQFNTNYGTSATDNSNYNNNFNNIYPASPLLRRVVSSDTTTPPTETLSHIMDMVLKSTDERARREMKTLVLKLLKENNLWISGSVDICADTIYVSCRICLEVLLDSFKQASEPDFSENSLEYRNAVYGKINLEADNVLWLVEILCDRNAADDFVMIWADQDELAQLHAVLPVTCRHVVSRITARLFVGIGKGEILPSKETKSALLNVWLKPLMHDYNWLQHGCRNFDRKIVEEGIGRTILTLPLEEQRNILLAWLGSFLQAGDSCPNLQRAFEVWWRRTFVRPYMADRN